MFFVCVPSPRHICHIPLWHALHISSPSTRASASARFGRKPEIPTTKSEFGELVGFFINYLLGPHYDVGCSTLIHVHDDTRARTAVVCFAPIRTSLKITRNAVIITPAALLEIPRRVSDMRSCSTERPTHLAHQQHEHVHTHTHECGVVPSVVPS